MITPGKIIAKKGLEQLAAQKFYDIIRYLLFGKKMTAGQVAGIDAILTAWKASGHTDLRWLAYILATVYHETARTMQPVKEFGGEKYLKSKKYYPYYGRDLVQTTWLENYKKVKAFTGVDVVSNPDLIADLDTAAKVAIEFMNKGYYTGRRLSNYFNKGIEDWFNARRIINGVDKAELIVGYAKSFYSALL